MINELSKDSISISSAGIDNNMKKYQRCIGWIIFFALQYDNKILYSQMAIAIINQMK